MLNKIKELLNDTKEGQKKSGVINQEFQEVFSTYTDEVGNHFVNNFLSIPEGVSYLDTKKDLLKDDLNSLTPLPVGEITIDRIYIYLDNEEIEVSSFIRNGTKSPISFNAVSLGIIDSNKIQVAQQAFPLGELGTIPPGGARPYNFRFLRENVFDKDFNQKECQLVFQPESNQTQTQKSIKLKLSNTPSWMSKEQLSDLEGYIAKLPIVLEGEFNIAGIDARFVEGEGLDALLLFRNGSKDEINLGKMPLAFIDIEGNELAAGVFDLNHITIDGHNAMLLSLTFDKSLFTFEGEPDLSAWAVALMDIDNDDLAS